RRVEAEAEEHAERIHLPALRDPLREPPDEEAVHEPAVEEAPLEALLVVRPVAQVEEEAHDLDEHDQVENPDQPEERAGHARADEAAVALEGRDAVVHRLRPERETGGEREDDRRVAEREEEA